MQNPQNFSFFACREQLTHKGFLTWLLPMTILYRNSVYLKKPVNLHRTIFWRFEELYPILPRLIVNRRRLKYSNGYIPNSKFTILGHFLVWSCIKLGASDGRMVWYLDTLLETHWSTGAKPHYSQGGIGCSKVERSGSLRRQFQSSLQESFPPRFKFLFGSSHKISQNSDDWFWHILPIWAMSQIRS